MPDLLNLVWRPSAKYPKLEDYQAANPYPYTGPAIYRQDDYTVRFKLFENVANVLVPYVPLFPIEAQIRAARHEAGVPLIVPDPIAEFQVTIGGVDGNEVTCYLDGDVTRTVPDTWTWDVAEVLDLTSQRTWFTGAGSAWGDITRAVA